MEEKQKIEILIENLNNLKETQSNAKTAFLDKPEVKKLLKEKFNIGIPLKHIHKSIVDSGFSISVATIRKWKEKNIGVKKIKRKSSNDL